MAVDPQHMYSKKLKNLSELFVMISIRESGTLNPFQRGDRL